MATVIVGPIATNPATLYPNLYSSCVWNFVTGWTCQTVDSSPSQPLPPSYDPTPPMVNPTSTSLALMPNAMSNDCGCCGSSGGSGAPVVTAGPVSVSSVATSKRCECGYTNREALLAMLLAFGVFLLLKK